MKVNFKYKRGFAGKFYGPGACDVPDSLTTSKYFKALVDCGDVSYMAAPAAPAPAPEHKEEAKPSIKKG